MLHLPPVASAIITILGVVLAVTRLLTASRPFWDSPLLPAWLQKGLPAALVAFGALPAALESAKSWTDVLVAAVIAGGTWFTASRGDKRTPLAKDGGPRTERVNSDPKIDETVRIIPPGPLLVLLLAGLALHQQGCGAPAAEAPCDVYTAAQITTLCSAEAYACGKNGGTEAECTTACDAKLDARAEECRK